jgi:hypothetical protein
MIIDSSEINFNEFVEKTKFKELSARDLIRNLISTLYNNPSKASVFLVTDSSPQTPYELQLQLNRYIFGCSSTSLQKQIRELKEFGIKNISRMTIESYFDGAIIKLSNNLAEKARIKMKTGLAEKELWGYRKTLDGAVFGDLVAFNCIMASSDPYVEASNYLIFGTANTNGESDSQIDTLLLLLYLNENKIYKPAPLHEIVSEIFEYKGSTFSKEYRKLKNRITVNATKRLNQAGLINYDVFRERIRYRSLVNEEEIEEKVSESIKKLKTIYSPKSIYKYKCYAKEILRYIIHNPGTSAEEILNYLGISSSYLNVRGALSMLRYAGLIEIVKGRTHEEQALINITKEGEYYVEEYVKPLLELLGIYDVFKDRISYSSLSKIVRPDLKRIYEERNEKIDSLMNYENLYEFQMRAIEARKRHQNESGHILRYSSQRL